MEVAMADDAADQQYSAAHSAAAAADVGWPYWSPVIGWNPDVWVAEDNRDVKGGFVWLSDEYALDGGSPETLECWSSAVSETTFSSAAATPADQEALTGEKNKGVRLIHLLSAAAEAITADKQNSHELSRVILSRLKELIPTPAAAGSSTERLAGHFMGALHRLIDGSSDGNRFVRRTAELTSASQLLQDMSPYVNFGHFTANQAILEAVGGQRRVHIVDWNIMEGGQWAPLMQAFVSMKDSPPPSHLKITAVTAGCKSEAAEVKETGQMLAGFAASIGLAFSFAQCRFDRDGYFRPAALKVLRGEAVVFNCALHAPHNNHHNADSVRSFLAGATAVGARLVTVVEEESGRRTSIEGGFLGRFMEELQRYSAIWEALEAGFPKQGRAREMVESMVLGPRIAAAVEMAYRRREEDEMEEETRDGWGEWMAVAGFGRMELSFFNQWQAKLLLGLFNDGYNVEEDAPNKLVLRWKSRRLVSASVWSTPKIEA
ncbi:Nodulation-signaling pathway 2 protein [Platanthera guangdongensis]|uniref:Nodulation-signaling pathway 2 protein n=1 Tax=Platanthera guangdongensis TaxID=2320717 RepID=A0ABR2LI65_9ASPA